MLTKSITTRVMAYSVLATAKEKYSGTKKKPNAATLKQEENRAGPRARKRGQDHHGQQIDHRQVGEGENGEQDPGQAGAEAHPAGGQQVFPEEPPGFALRGGGRRFFTFAGDHEDIDGAAVPDQVVHQG